MSPVVLNIVFENEELVVVDKPYEMLSVPSRLGAEDERSCVLPLLSKQLQMKVYPTHRLDYEVSGLLCFAKNPQSHRVMNAMFEERKIEKTYEALTLSNAKFKTQEEFRWEQKLHRGKRRSYEASHGKEAVTTAVLERELPLFGQNCFYWKLRPITGRAHQLRVALASQGMPILGDELYGGMSVAAIKGIALRSIELRFNEASKEAKALGLPECISVKSFISANQYLPS